MPLNKIDGKWPPIIEGNHVRVRLLRPLKIPGVKYRAHDMGGRRHTKRIAMYDPRTKRWKTQGWIFPIRDVVDKRPSTVAILKKINSYDAAMKLVKPYVRRFPIATGLAKQWLRPIKKNLTRKGYKGLTHEEGPDSLYTVYYTHRKVRR